MRELYLAGGCFWGVERYFQMLKGINKTSVGYANGDGSNPTYLSVVQGKDNHQETIYLSYDENIISLDKILDHFFNIIDPYSKYKQGNDIGNQYRTGIYTNDKFELVKIKKYVLNKFNKTIYAEVSLLKNYFLAEDYHQNYLVKNPNGYCHVNLNIINKEDLKDEYK